MPELIGPSGAVLQDPASMLEIQVRHGDVVEAGVGPKNGVGDVVDSHGVGPAELGAIQLESENGTAVHAHFADVGRVAPVRPVEVAVVGIYNEGSRLLEKHKKNT